MTDIRWVQRFDKEKNLIVMKVLNCRHSRNLLSGIYRARRPPTHALGGDGFEGAGFEGAGFEGAGFEGDDVVFILERLYHHQRPDV